MWHVVKKHKFLFLFLTLLLLGTALRLFRVAELYHFTYDEEVFAFVGKRMWINHHIPLIGGVTPMHVHLAPYFYWFSGLLLGLSKLNPLGWGVAAAGLSAVTMSVLFVVAKKMFGRVTAFFVLTLYAFSFYQNIFDRHYWGLAFNGVISLGVIYSIYKLAKGQQKYLYALALTLAFGFHTDPSTLVLGILALFSWKVLKIQVDKKTFIVSAALFLLSFAPLVVFDIRHDFSNSRGILQYMDELKTPRESTNQLSLQETFLFVPNALARTLFVFGDTDLAKQYSYCTQHTSLRIREVPIVFTVLVIVIFILLLKQLNLKRDTVGLKIILLLLVSTYLGVTIYGVVFKGMLYDHYVSTLFPVFLLSVAFVLSTLWQKNKLFAISVLVIFMISNLALLQTANHRFGFKDKVDAVQWAIASTGNEEISLDVISSCFRYNGYRYLFYLYGKDPAKSYVDANFTHLFDKPPASYHPDTLVVITNPDFEETQEYYSEYTQLKANQITSRQFGNIEVLIVDNKDKEFIGKY